MTPARGRVFLSYRRDDTRHVAGRIADRLAGRIGSHQVFMDVDTIEPGVDFTVALVQAVESCDVLLTLIGPDWITDLQRRHGRDDFVILEIGTALTRGIRVIPVLVDGAAIPTEASLPPDIRSLTRRNAVRLDHETFQSDVERLLAAVEKALQPNHATAGASTARLPIVGPIIPAHRDAAAFPLPKHGRSSPRRACRKVGYVPAPHHPYPPRPISRVVGVGIRPYSPLPSAGSAWPWGD